MTEEGESLCADFERTVIDGASAGSDSALHKKIPRFFRNGGFQTVKEPFVGAGALDGPF
jgi:hypothetical protein